jgi:cysteine desulfurase
MKKRIYLDNNATTGIDPIVLESMLSELNSTPGNASSIHFFGQEAKNRLQNSRALIASYLNVKPHEIFFTSGGTESMNMLIRGFFPKEISGHAITSNVEHSCVYKTLKSLQEKGLDVSFLPAGLLGAVSPEQVKAAIKPNTRFIVLNAVSNETGIKHDLEAIGKVAQEAEIPLIVDGVSWMGKEPVIIPPGVSGIGFSGHKFHGPKGIGFAYIKSSLRLCPLLTGGDQEYSLRAGTENLAGIIGLAKAVELLKTYLPEATQRMALLRDKLEAGLIQKANPVVVNGIGPRICNTCNLSFPHTLGEDLVIALDMAGIATSHGSACSSGALEPPRVLTSMGVPFDVAKSAVRFSLCRYTTMEEIDQTIEIVSEIVKRLRS